MKDPGRDALRVETLGGDRARACAFCGRPLVRRTYEDLSNWKRRRHCDKRCAAEEVWRTRKSRKASRS